MSDPTCFIIAPIGDPDSDTRKRSDQILKHVLTPAVRQCGYAALRADQISEPGIITSQVIQHIVDDPLVLADLTERNPNVFYELAIRHAIRKPLVQIIRKGDPIPFDVAGTRTIHVDHHDLDSVEQAKSEIIRQVEYLHANQSDIETPISVSLDLQLLKQSDNPEQRSLADVLVVMADVRHSIERLDKRLEGGEYFSRFAKHLNESMLHHRRQLHLVPEMRVKLERLEEALGEVQKSFTIKDAKAAQEIREMGRDLRDMMNMVMHNYDY